VTTYYVSHLAAGAATGADRTNAFLTLAAAFGAATPTIIYVASDHVEAQGSAMTLTAPGTSIAPTEIYCVDFAGRADPTAPISADLRTTAAIGTAGAFDVTIGGFCNVDGVILNAGSGAVSASIRVAAAAHGWRWRNCELKLGGSTGGNIVLGTFPNYQELENTGLRFGAAASQLLLNACSFTWRNTASALRGATMPTSLFSTSGAAMATATIDGVDLSPTGSGKNIVNGSLAPAPTKLYFSDCKLDAAVTRYAAVTAVTYATEAWFTRCGSAGNFDFSKHTPIGALTCETTVVRTGGASDGTQVMAYKVVTGANAKWRQPFECPPLAIWNDVIASTITVTVYGVWTGGALPNNDDIWMDIQKLGAAGSPLASIDTTTKADGLAAGVAVDADGSTWGGGTTVFKLTKTITAPAQKGDILVFIRVGAASATAYFDPKVVIT
jgi:hypothetical protein